MTDQSTPLLRQDIPEKKTLHWLNLPDRLTEFAQETSIHGLSFAAQTSYSGLKRLTWFFLFLGSLMYAGLQLKTASEGQFFISCTAHTPYSRTYMYIVPAMFVSNVQFLSYSTCRNQCQTSKFSSNFGCLSTSSFFSCKLPELILSQRG